MKHLTYLKTKPSAFVDLQSRVDALHKPFSVMQSFGSQLVAEYDKASSQFNKAPTEQNARIMVMASLVKRHFNDVAFVQSAHSECSHAQSSLRRDATSFAVYIPILSKVAELLREDIATAREKIASTLNSIDADVDVDTVKPLPALRMKLEHVEDLLGRAEQPPLRNDGLVDQIHAIINGNLPEPRTPHVPHHPQQGFPVGGVARV